MLLAPSLHIMVDPRMILEKAEIKKNARVADFGCGTHGNFIFASAEAAGQDGIVYAVDIQQSVLEAIKSKKSLWPAGARVELIWADLEKTAATTIPPASIDAGFLINVLNQSNKQEKIIEECARLIKPGGQLIVVDWANTGASFAPRQCNAPTPEKIIAAAELHGMKVVDKFNASRYHFGLKLAKQV